jgi:hypothetical protein
MLSIGWFIYKKLKVVLRGGRVEMALLGGHESLSRLSGSAFFSIWLQVVT